MNRAERRKNELRERILAAAFELFLSQGVSATRIDENSERADMESCDDKDVEYSGLLEGDGFIAVYEGAITQQHRPQNAVDLRRVWEDQIKFAS